METKDIVLQVSEETAGIMEEISNQMFDETDARFEEVNQLIKEVIANLENFVEEFEDCISKSKKDFINNREEMVKEFRNIQERIAGLVELTEKQDRYIYDNQKGNTEKLEILIEEEQHIKNLIQTLEVSVGEMASSVEKISVKQNEISEKQDKLEQDVEYLKLPFYKKWFRKGN